MTTFNVSHEPTRLMVKQFSLVVVWKRQQSLWFFSSVRGTLLATIDSNVLWRVAPDVYHIFTVPAVASPSNSLP